MKIIEVTIGPKGETKIETKGFSGAACQDATRALEQALGNRRTERLTTEFHRSSSATQREQTSQG